MKRSAYRVEFDKAVAHKMYQEGMSYRAIAEKLGLSRTAVSRNLQKEGCVNLPKKRNPFDVTEAHRMYMDCVSISDICEKFGISVSYLYNSFHANGLEVCCLTERKRRKIINSTEYQTYLSIHERYMKGESLDALCGEVGVSVSCLYRRFRSLGLKVCNTFESHVVNKNRIIASKRWNEAGISKVKEELYFVDWDVAYKRYLECKDIGVVAEEFGICRSSVFNNFKRLGLYVRNKKDIMRDRKKDGSYYKIYSKGRKTLILLTNPLQIKLHKAIPDSVLEHACPPYFLDIAVPEFKIDIECDGREHRINKQVVFKDFFRDKEMKSRGWTVFRFTYREIEDEFDECVLQITQKILECKGTLTTNIGGVYE